MHRCSWCSMPSSRPKGLQTCQRCRVPRYCSKVCQSAHWKAGDKEQCKEKMASTTANCSIQETGETPPCCPADLPARERDLLRTLLGYPAYESVVLPSIIPAGSGFDIEVESPRSLRDYIVTTTQHPDVAFAEGTIADLWEGWVVESQA